MTTLRVDDQAGADLEIALTEACANVVKHASGADGYEVRLDVGHDHCSIDVVDDGTGFDPAAGTAPAATSERGRGLFLIRALAENVRMQSSPRTGSLIHFEKSFA
ncbi:serine/threonine-protein kinase RsbW [Actinoplanes octamycinicus]|uniref:Serine/threonine-protein kinase RsbW n=1 Tax=Actinoplanes octamycinicus TaxID=135948 RepID=A0A7W7H893_9ACTN|nr:serine/threonine-protein kinase RsbW [Actinoplanes octamycinicus]